MVAFLDFLELMFTIWWSGRSLWRWERITRGDNTDYMWRFIVFKSDYLKIFVHIFQASDDECLHDHPWDFVSFIIWGGYWEKDRAGNIAWYSPGSILRRRANWAHRVMIDRKAVSVVIASRKRRNWGFYSDIGWLPWERYNQTEHCK